MGSPVHGGTIKNNVENILMPMKVDKTYGRQGINNEIKAGHF
jgi:hypothetical protein